MPPSPASKLLAAGGGVGPHDKVVYYTPDNATTIVKSVSIYCASSGTGGIQLGVYARAGWAVPFLTASFTAPAVALLTTWMVVPHGWGVHIYAASSLSLYWLISGAELEGRNLVDTPQPIGTGPAFILPLPA